MDNAAHSAKLVSLQALIGEWTIEMMIWATTETTATMV